MVIEIKKRISQTHNKIIIDEKIILDNKVAAYTLIDPVDKDQVEYTVGKQKQQEKVSIKPWSV